MKYAIFTTLLMLSACHGEKSSEPKKTAALSITANQRLTNLAQAHLNGASRTVKLLNKQEGVHCIIFGDTSSDEVKLSCSQELTTR